ncbi:MAG: leucyl aminopeptidase [Polyangiaceae bacterium]|nr:leucyl aminopeptidase [Polyangiaceae bacterium]
MTMKVTLSTSDPLSVAADLAVIGIVEGSSPKAGPLATLTKALGPVVSRTLKREEFTGKKDQTVEFSTNGQLKPARVVLMGLGQGPVTEAQVRTMAAKAARVAQASRAATLVLDVPQGVQSSVGAGGGERAAAEGVVLGAYRFTRYFTGDRQPKSTLDRVTLATAGRVSRESRAAVEVGQRVGEAICIARDLINEPPNELYPETFARFCAELCKERGIKCTVLDKAALTKRGMKLMLAVAQGSARDPRLIHMVYTPSEGKPKKKLVFVGKGLTFDSGGLCIKPAQGMEDMKGDMGGAANVVALMAALAALQLPVEVHGLIGAVENMPDGNAYRPGDIFGSLDGKFVEIINTDAEGRLVLADVLAYGRELKPDLMLDNATLTGACIVALGTLTSGFFTSQDDLADKMRRAASEAGESMWHMPLLDELREGLKSDWADLKHTADRWGGSITAALFLREFVGQTPWIHVDIAGPSMAHRAYGIHPKGGTGHGVLTYLKLIDVLLHEV